MEADDMNTMTRLWTVLILCILLLTLNVLAVVEDLYVLPEDKAADTTLASARPNSQILSRTQKHASQRECEACSGMI